MTAVRDKVLFQLGPFTGINNLANTKALKVSELITANNVDLDDSGIAYRRKGWLRLNSSTTIHSLMSYEDMLLCVQAGILKLISSDGATLTSIYTLSNNRAMSSTMVNGDLYMTNRNDYIAFNSAGVISFPSITATYKRAMLPGDYITFYKGRVYTALGNILALSDAVAYHSRDIRLSRIRMPDKITMIRSVDDGMYVSTRSKVYFISGDEPSSFSIKEVFNYPAQERTDSVFDSSLFGKLRIPITGPAVVFHTKVGICAGLQSGTVLNLTKGVYANDSIETYGSTMYLNSRDFTQYIALVAN